MPNEIQGVLESENYNIFKWRIGNLTERTDTK